ncbi:hypothetical protein M422DRAFT_243357 [Sphaerobolus stellatus SS14]|nr:hypothetical protein M422DRAFT_243357 [Sphaerobolus stellatus SS14]
MDNGIGANLDEEPLTVTFHPPLFLQRQTWILDILRRETVESVLDIGCGDGPLLQALVQPPWSRPPPFDDVETRDIYLHTLHGLDPSAYSILSSNEGIMPEEGQPFTGQERWARRQARWTELDVFLWEGGFELMDEEMFENRMVDAFVATEVIEHLPSELLPLFAPILLGRFRPRLLLLTTPNYNYNQRFSAPGKAAPTGYLDPTGRTNRVFRHNDHKLEWTPDEWNDYCTSAAKEFGYEVEVGGLGQALEPDPWHREVSLGFATQIAVFKRTDALALLKLSIDIPVPISKLVLKARYHHHTHPLSLEELAEPCDFEDIREAVQTAMLESESGSMMLQDLWKEGQVSLRCKGDVAQLIQAFEVEDMDLETWNITKKEAGWKMEITWLKFVPLPKDTSGTGTETSPELNEELEEEEEEDLSFEELDYEANAVEVEAEVGEWELTGWGTLKTEEGPLDNGWGWPEANNVGCSWEA